MLSDLDTSIQFAPINQLVKLSISHCTGTSMNDSLMMLLKKLISEDHIYAGGLQQAVSPHLMTKYSTFLVRICEYILQNDRADNYADNIMSVGVAMISAATDSNSVYLLSAARTIFQQITYPHTYVSSKKLYFLAKTYSDNYKPDSCYILLKQSLACNPNKTVAEKILYASTLYFLGGYCYGHNKRDSAFILFRDQLKARKEIYGEVSSEYAYWMIVTADQYTYLSKYALAQQTNFRALNITSQTLGEKTSQYALCLNNIGEVYYRKGEYDKALPYAQRSLAIKREIFGDTYFDNVVSLHNLATVYTRMGLYNEAIPLLQQSLEISKKYFGEKMVYAFDLHPLAEVYSYMGEYGKALPLYQRSIQIQQQIQKEDGGTGRDAYYPGVLHSIATLYTKLGQYDKAISIFKQTLQIKKEISGELNSEYAKSLNGYAEVCLLKGDIQTALSLQFLSLRIGKKLFGNTHPNISVGLYNLASLYYAQHDYFKAEETCNAALVMQNKIYHGPHPDVAATLDLLGDIMRTINQDKKAAGYYQQALSMRKDVVAITHPAYIASLYNLGLINTKNRLYGHAAKLFMEADSAALVHIRQSHMSLSEDEKLVYLHKAETQFNHLPSLLYLNKARKPEIANHIYTNTIILKSMVLLRQQQIYNDIRRNGDSAAVQVYNEWRINKAILGKQLMLPRAARISNFDSLQEVTTQKERELSHISASFRNFNFQEGIGVRDVQHNLSHDEAAVEMIRFKLFRNNWTDSVIYAVLLLLPGKENVLFIPLCEERQLKKMLRFANNNGEAAVNYLYPPANKNTPASSALYKLVWQPIEKYLNGVHTIYYSPVGLLNKLSFAAIHTNGMMLSDTYDLRQLLCTRSLTLRENGAQPLISASLWGDIDYEDDGNQSDSLNIFGASSLVTMTKKFNPLPGTKEEVQNIGSILKEKKIECVEKKGSFANEKVFKELDGKSPTILHIATHGFFVQSGTYSPDAMLRSGLLLAGSNKSLNGFSGSGEDGILTAYEISHLDLSNTLLATLSGCETAQGNIEDNEGVYGLQRGFKMAGVKQVLMSLWAVPDKETTELMLNFYNNLLHDNDANTALKLAQLSMKRKYSPYYWAGFVLTE
jgi:CHAT domain-containing protein/tetratricopeptide (TPR) repeat protein